MKFAFDTDLAELEGGALAFLEDANSVERLREDGDKPEKLWTALASVGLLGLTAKTEDGGLGLGASDALRICQSFGYSNLPEPVGETVAIIVPLLTELLPDGDDRVSRLIAGEARTALSHTMNPCINLLEGSDELLLVAGDQIALYPTQALDFSSVQSIDPWRNPSLVDRLPAPSLILAEGRNAEQHHARVGALGAVEAAAELCGLAGRMIELATAYAGERQQFGQVIGKFQAVKHLLATAQTRLEFARPVVYRAAASMDSPQRNLYAAHAKVAATDAAILAGETAIQVFGGMGYTYEADLHYFMKRCWALAGNWGSREQHLNVIETSVLEGGIDIGPGTSFNR